MAQGDGLYDFRLKLANAVLAKLGGQIVGISAHFGESHKRGNDPEAVAYRKLGADFHFLAFAFAPWRMWDLHVGSVPVSEDQLSIGYHISERAAPLLLDQLRALAAFHKIEVRHRPKVIEFQANIPLVTASPHSVDAVATTVCDLCHRMAGMARATSCPLSMRS